jgi:fructan beta-fructosidase
MKLWHTFSLAFTVWCSLLGAFPDAIHAADDILIADFEGETYGEWKTTGDAFGPGPARGTLPGQMPVTGFKGKGLANSFYGGDKSTGTLSSPPFKIERKFINFLIGGGKHPGKTCMNLMVDDKIVRTATGPNDKPGGSEHLDWHTWNVEEFLGKSAVLQIVDNETGGWGHINIDHIVQSERKLRAEPAQRDIVVDKRYLHLPVKTRATVRRMRFVVDGKTVREFEIELADGDPSFWAFSDVSMFKGRTLRLEVDALSADSKGLSSITQGDDIKGEPLYEEKHRPQFHFTSRRGWLNDPNGLVYFEGEYHLFYQHNPYGWNWGNMHWGHAVSKDLVHWKELGIALYPKQFGDWAFSGSAVVDTQNTSGFQQGKDPPLVAAFTSTGRGECIVYSNDRGRTWKEYEGNPVVKHTGRDPRLIWYDPGRHWVMAVYDELQGKRWIAFYTSPDLKKWEFQSRIEGFFECPDLLECRFHRAKGQPQWVLYAADGKYMLGDFDGKKFTPKTGKLQLWYGNFYAAQTFNGEEGNSAIQIGWGNGITFPNMPFNQQMTVPCYLGLESTEDGPRMSAYPASSINALRGKKHEWKNEIVKPGENLLKDVKGDLFDIDAEIELHKADAVGFMLRGTAVTYDAKKMELSCGQCRAPLKPENGRIQLRIFVDRGSVEVFANLGRVAMSVGVVPPDDNKSLAIFARGGEAKVKAFPYADGEQGALQVFELKSAWKK